MTKTIQTVYLCAKWTTGDMSALLPEDAEILDVIIQDGDIHLLIMADNSLPTLPTLLHVTPIWALVPDNFSYIGFAHYLNDNWLSIVFKVKPKEEIG